MLGFANQLRTESVQELTSLLEAIRDEVEAIAHVERLKSFAIAGRNLDDLAEITSRQEANTRVLQALEERRHTLVLRLASADLPEPTVHELATGIGGPAGEALRTAADDLRSTIEQLRGAAHRNRDLLQWASALAGAVAQWLLGYGQATPAYTRSGGLQREDQLSARGWTA